MYYFTSSTYIGKIVIVVCEGLQNKVRWLENIYPVTPTLTQGLKFCGPIRRIFVVRQAGIPRACFNNTHL
jgi:hypothetical protein